MIITSENKDLKLHKKLLPEKVIVATSFLCFISTEDEMGVVTYKSDNVYSPFEHKQELKTKKIKLKQFNFGELINEIDKLTDINNKYIKKAKTEYLDKFETSCEAKFLETIYELNLVENKVELTKRLVCILTAVENLERSFVSDTVCSVLPVSKLKEENITTPEWLKYFLQKQ